MPVGADAKPDLEIESKKLKLRITGQCTCPFAAILTSFMDEVSGCTDSTYLIHF